MLPSCIKFIIKFVLGLGLSYFFSLGATEFYRSATLTRYENKELTSYDKAGSYLLATRDDSYTNHLLDWELKDKLQAERMD